MDLLVVLLLLSLMGESQLASAECDNACYEYSGTLLRQCKTSHILGNGGTSETGGDGRGVVLVQCDEAMIFNETQMWYELPDGVTEIVITSISILEGARLVIGRLICSSDDECFTMTLTSDATPPISIKLKASVFKIQVVGRISEPAVVYFTPVCETFCENVGGYCYDDRCNNCAGSLKLLNLCGDDAPPHRRMCCMQDTSSSCTKSFSFDSPASNSIVLADQSRLLDTQTNITLPEKCLELCCQNDACCKAVFTQDSRCALYTYIPDSQLPIPEGAVVIKEGCCYNGENIMGEVVLRLDRKNVDDSQSACAADQMTLAMPKTECAYKILEQIAEAKKAQAGNIIWLGINNPTGQHFIFNDGDTPDAHDFVFPLGPTAHEQEHELKGIFYNVNGWKIGDWNGHQNMPFLCQSVLSCSKPFLRETPPSNAAVLADASLLLDTIAGVTSADDCEAFCCVNDKCCKAVYTQDSNCLLYSYLLDTLLPVPAGATVLKNECCYNAEQIMGDVIVRLDKKNVDDSQAACEADGMTLAMPKTECAFKILEQLVGSRRAQTGNILWVGISNPTGQQFIFNDGDTPEAHGFVLPLGPPSHEQEHEKKGIFYYVNGWGIGDWNGHQLMPFICQSNTS